MNITLELLNENNWYTITQLSVSEEQKEIFPVPNVYWIGSSRYEEKNELYAIKSDDEYVGLIGGGFDSNGVDGLIEPIMIDQHYQGRGIAGQAIELMIKHLGIHLSITKVYIEHGRNNTAMKYILDKLGFKTFDEDDEGFRRYIDISNINENESALYDDNFPRSNKYDFMWVLRDGMGPHPLWLTEFLVQPFKLKPGMRVLDLACGKGMTSVFLAREFGVQVYAVDFDEWEGWTSTEIRWDNAIEYNVENLVIPIKADARNLPFAPGFFDAIICVDAYIYFGQEDDYLQNILQFLRPGGKIGMIVPGYMKDVSTGVPEYIVEFLGDELWTWQTESWWKALWEKDDDISLDVVDTMPNGCDLWLRYDTAMQSSGLSQWPDETDLQRRDNGEYIGFIRMVATKN